MQNYLSMKIIDRFLFHLSQPHLNVLKTAYLNFKLLPFHIAIRFPILIYGPVRIYWLLGKIEIRSNNIYRGMIKLGRNNEFFNGVDRSSFILLGEKSKLIFEGPCAISTNYKIRVAANAQLKFGAYTFIGSSVKIVCTKYISIGSYTRCAYESQFIDSNFHYVYNESTKEVKQKDGKIIIGAFNWIGNRTTINKGTYTKDHTIVCAGSLLNKKYDDAIDKQMLGGVPAKIINNGYVRIFSISIEKYINQYFIEHESEKQIILENSGDNNLTELENWFKK